jgi:hypothetical protein
MKRGVKGSSKVSIGENPASPRLDPDAGGAGAAVLAQFGRFGYRRKAGRGRSRLGDTAIGSSCAEAPHSTLAFDAALS